MKRLTLLLLLLSVSVVASATTVSLTGTITVNNNPVNGTLTLQLPVPAIDTSTNQAIAPSPFTFRLINGAVQAGAAVTPTDVMQPQNMWYTAQVRDTAGALLYTAIYVVPSAPSTFNIGLALPTIVTTSNISYLTPASLSLTSPQAFQGAITAGSINNILAVDGTRYTTLAAAKADCPAAGCTIDMRGNATALSLGTFDPGNGGPAITLLLGPYFYTATQITVRPGLRIIGVGRGAVGNVGTAIQAQSTTLPLFVGPGATQAPAIDAWFQSFDLFGPGVTTCNATVQSNVTDGFFFDASTSTTGQSGLWYSTFSDVQMCGFSTSFHFKGPSTVGANGTNQYINFHNVTVLRPNGGVNALRIEGGNYQFTFTDNSQFDSYIGNVGIDANANPLIFIGGGPGTNTAGYPYIMKFNGVTAQGTGTAVQIDGGKQISFDHGHHEQVNGVYSVTFGANGANVNTDNLVISETSFNGNVGKNAGSGYLLKVNTANAAGIEFRHNYYNATGQACPDNVVWNTPTGAKTAGNNNEFDCTGNTPTTQGMTLSMAAAATINVGTAHTASLTTGPTVTTINGGMLPGEYLTIQEANDGSFGTGGNIDLGGPASINVLAGHTATFVRTDIASHTWQLVSTDQPPTTVFASLGTPTNNRLIFCSDCTIANPCAGGGTGALAKRLNGVWVCN